jgi:hypothetical protein
VKEIDRLLQQVRAAGWTVDAGEHYKCRSPEGHLVIVSKTPSAQGAIKAIKGDFRRAGLDLDRRQ